MGTIVVAENDYPNTYSVQLFASCSSLGFVMYFQHPAAIFTIEALINPLYTTCRAPNCKVSTGWWMSIVKDGAKGFLH